MARKAFSNIFVFLIIFIAISIAADLYYYNRIAQKDDKGQICYSDFRVFWYAGYNLKHHIVKFLDRPKGYPTFRQFWFLNPKLHNEPIERAPSNWYIVYDRDVKFYHFRYSPFVAFAMIPFGKIAFPADAILIWYCILNIAFLAALLLMINQLNKDFGLHQDWRKYLVLWGAFIATLRFYLMNIYLGQADILIVLFFVLFLISYVKTKQVLCGILLALILQFKLFFVPILIYFLFIKRAKIVLSTIISFVCLVLIPAYIVGIEKAIGLLRDWIEILGISLPSQILNAKNQSLTYIIGSLFLKIRGMRNLAAYPEYLFYLISAALTLSTYIMIAGLRLKGFEEKLDERKFKYLEISILIMASLLFSPLAWEAHYINLMIPFGIAVYFTMNSVKRSASYTLLVIFFLLSCVAGTDLTKFIPFVNKFHAMNIALGTIFLGFATIYAYRQTMRG